jgi:hypothetical protein
VSARREAVVEISGTITGVVLQAVNARNIKQLTDKTSLLIIFI